MGFAEGYAMIMKVKQAREEAALQKKEAALQEKLLDMKLEQAQKTDKLLGDAAKAEIVRRYMEASRQQYGGAGQAAAPGGTLTSEQAATLPSLFEGRSPLALPSSVQQLTLDEVDPQSGQVRYGPRPAENVALDEPSIRLKYQQPETYGKILTNRLTEQEIAANEQFDQLPGAATPQQEQAPVSPQERLRQLEAQRAQLEERRRQLFPFTRSERGKRGYDAVGSQLDDVNQQIKYIQDEEQEERRFRYTEERDERRFQQSERRFAMDAERTARVEARAADAQARSARALELQGESAARAARTGNINAESTLRGDFQQDTKDYRQVRDAWGKVVTSAKDPSAAGDLSLIFGYMKLLDPTSVVREGEFATAQNAAGVPERVIAQYNKLLSGERLSDATRKDFVDRGKKLYDQYTKDYQGVRKQYRGIAERQGLDPNNVTLDYESTVQEPQAPATGPAPAGPPAPGGFTIKGVRPK